MSIYWADREFLVTQVEPSGSHTRTRPQNFGAIGNAHQVKFFDESNPWNFDFEPLFGPADSEVDSIVDFLAKIELPFGVVDHGDGFSFNKSAINAKMRDSLADLLSSMLIRSPQVRDKLWNSVVYFLSRFGVTDVKKEKNLIAANIHNKFGFLSNNMRTSGIISILFSDSEEFIFGDGFPNYILLDGQFYKGEWIIMPLLPTVVVIFTNDGKFVRDCVLTSRISVEKTRIINELVQIYAKERIFYRSSPPVVSEYFRRGEHLAIDPSESSFIISLFAEIRAKF